MMVTENFHGDDGRAALNAAGAELLNEQEREARFALIHYAAKVITLFAEVDAKLLETASEAPGTDDVSFGLYILEDVIHGAESDDGIPICQTLLLVGDIEDGQTDSVKLRLFVPVSSSAQEFLEAMDSGSESEQASADLPKEVYFEVFGDEDDDGIKIETRRYAVAHGDVFAYTSAADGEEPKLIGKTTADTWDDRRRTQVNTRLSTIADLHAMIINKRAVAQRIVVVHNGVAQPIDAE